MMDREARQFRQKWHEAVNSYMSLTNPAAKGRFDEAGWMYEAMDLFGEVPRLTLLHGMERRGELTATHRQCSHAESEPVPDNHLTCCLGKKTRECPYLAAIESAELTDDQKDAAKAWTCATHIVHSGGDPAKEGYLLTVDDQMYWSRVYESLAAGDPEAQRGTAP